jgi:DNA polymerase-3 subunit alpha
VVSSDDLSFVLPLEIGPDGRVLTQYDKDGTKDAGVLKLDILGSRALTQLRDTLTLAGLDSVGVRAPVDDSVGHPPIDDAPTFQLLRSGRTIGCLQLESPGMRRLLVKIQPENSSDLVAVLSLYRPGPIEGGMTEAFARRRAGLEDIEFPHPKLADVLEDTYGVFLYQEQIMEAARRIAGFSLGEADVIRKGIAKGRGSRLEEMRERFMAGSRANGVSREVAAKLFRSMSSFAGFAFNKAHSTAYARAVYEACYLKAHHPAGFIAAILNARRGYYAPAQYVEEARRLGLRVLGPDVNHSDAACSVEDGAIRLGLRFVRGIGSETSEGIAAERLRKGPFSSFFEFRQRLFRARVHIHRDALENLIRSGALDCLGRNRPTHLAWLAMSPSLEDSPTLAGFELGGGEAEMPDWRPNRKLAEEHAVLGFCPGEHVLEERMPELAGMGVVSFETAVAHPGRKTRLCGIPVHLRSLDFDGRRTIVGTFEDPSALFEVSFPRSDFYAPLREVRRCGAAILEGIMGSPGSPLRVTDIRALELFD